MNTKLKTFFYLLLRDELTVGKMERIMQDVTKAGGNPDFSSSFLENYAESLAKEFEVPPTKTEQEAAKEWLWINARALDLAKTCEGLDNSYYFYDFERDSDMPIWRQMLDRGIAVGQQIPDNCMRFHLTAAGLRMVKDLT